MTSPEAAFTELGEGDPGATQPRASGVAPKNADEPAANQSFAHLPTDAGLLGYLNVSLRQRRFMAAATWHLPLLPNPFPVWAQVATTGLLGGYFSVLLRLGGLRWCAEYNANYQQVDRLFYNVAANFGLSMLEGGVGATILCMLLLANVLSGDVFPRFHDIPKDITEAISAYPVNGTDTAKLLVWALIAGFSERLVPDFLSSLAERKKDGPAATETHVEKG